MLAKGPRYRVHFRRRREGKTDYYYRRRLLTSRIPRFVVRKSLKYINIQIATAELIGDKILVCAHSSELKKKYGWPYNCKNIPAAYLTGLLAGYKAQKAGIEKAILDIGIYRPIVHSKLFAALKGAIDSGFDIPHGDGIFPTEDRIKGKHIEDYASLLSEQSSEEMNTF
ncbi:MAG: 50S ribosomal protein L18, partial [Candidatus Helarchaeales archaeon]